MRKVEEDSFTKTCTVLLGGQPATHTHTPHVGGVTVKSDSVRELGSSSLANLRLHDDVMKTNY